MTDPEPTRLIVIYDTGIVLQSVLNPDSPAARALGWAEHPAVQAVISNRLRSEYEEVLRRPALRERFAPLRNPVVVEGQLERIDGLMRRVPNPPEQIEYPRDPKDAPLINLAIFYDARFLVTRDRDLLDLDSDPVLRKRSPALRLVDPVVFLRAVEDLASNQLLSPENPEPPRRDTIPA